MVTSSAALPPANRAGFAHFAGRSSSFRESRCRLARLPASRRNRAPPRPRASLLSLLALLACHGRLPWLIIRQNSTRFRRCRRRVAPGGPCSHSCSIPLALRAHMSASRSRGHTSNRARSRPACRRRRRQDIVLSASASIHKQPSASRRNSCRPVCRLGRSRGPHPLHAARAACALAPRSPRSGTPIRRAASDAWSPRACARPPPGRAYGRVWLQGGGPTLSQRSASAIARRCRRPRQGSLPDGRRRVLHV